MTTNRMAELLEPYLNLEGQRQAVPEDLLSQLVLYLDLLIRWNARTNLTAIRNVEEMVHRHFGESVFTGLCLRRMLGENATVLDFGSGAGFPGIPVQLVNPGFRVTLAESQGKKAAFLREVVRVLECGAEVWAARVEAMPVQRRFSAVTLRAVDRMEAMGRLARERVLPGGVLVELSAAGEGGRVYAVPERSNSFVCMERMA